MKLITCHIENFGKFTNETFSFTDGCNVICQANGWGKSTLAAFIKVMFFGFDNEGKRNDLENERKRYKPWQGGVYGGRLTFETDGISYTVIRTFGSKEKEDTFELRETATNLASRKFSQNLGEELFRIDAASFERTVFLYQNQWEMKTTDRIHAKLGNLAENTDDINNFDTAYKRLTDLLNASTPRRKTGSLYKLQDEIRGLEEAVRGKGLLEKSISETETYLKEEKERKKNLQDNQKEWQEKLNILSSYQDAKVTRERYGALLEEETERKAALTEAAAYFPGEVPAREVLENLTREAASLPEKARHIERFCLTDAEWQEFAHYGVVFAAGVPESEELEQKLEQAKCLNRMKSDQQKDMLDESEKERLAGLEKIFEDGAPESDEIVDKISRWRSRSEIKSELLAKKAARDAVLAKNPAPKKQGISIAFVAALVLIGLGIAAFFLHPAAGVVLMLVAAAAFAVALSRKNQKPEPEPEVPTDALYLEITELEEEARKIEDEVGRFLQTYHITYMEDRVLEQIFGLKEKAEQYLILKMKQLEAENHARGKKIEELTIEIASFLGRFKDFARQSTLEESVALLQRYSERYLLLLNKEEHYRETKAAWEAGDHLVRSTLEQFGIRPEADLMTQLETIRSHQGHYETCKKEWERSREERAAFEKLHDMETLRKKQEPTGDYTLEEAGARLTEITEEIEENGRKTQLYENQLEDRYAEMEDMLDKEEILSMKKEEFRRKSETFRHLELTRDFLEQAKTSFTARYTEPVWKGFEKYHGLMEGKTAEACMLDANMNLTVDEKGRQREVGFFSAGYQNLYGLCMRMALVDAMYTEEKPFIVLDDPFVNLDPAKTKGGMKFLEEAGKEYQILYFTCHESRT